MGARNASGPKERTSGCTAHIRAVQPHVRWINCRRCGLSALMFYLLEAGFETLVTIWPTWSHQLVRGSAAPYNTLEEYQALCSTKSSVGWAE